VYLAVAVIVWLHVWTGHPNTVITCGCGDPASSIWFTAWPAYALAHGHNPLFSTAVGYPEGINLIFAAYGIVLAPITWVFGAVAALNVALTISPVLSAVAMFALARRWVSWVPAAFVAGLLYGFSPFVMANLGSAHIDLVLLAVPPLVVICLDDLLIHQRRRPVAMGIALGALCAVQFFIGIEVLVLMVIEAMIGIALIVVYAGLRDPDALRRKARGASVGVLAALVTAVVLLAWPIGFALAGPAHFSSLIHPGVRLSSFTGSTRGLVTRPTPSLQGAFSAAYYRIVGGYQGPIISQQYLGYGIFAVVVAGTVAWRQDRRLWLFGLLALGSLFVLVSGGPILASLPILKNVVPLHVVIFAILALAVMLAIITDKIHRWVGDWVTTRRATRTGTAGSGAGWVAGVLAGLVVAAVAVTPPAAYVATGIPLTLQSVTLPHWFTTVAPRLRDHPVVLALPAPFTVTKAGLTWRNGSARPISLAISGKQSALAWQALSGQRFAMVGAGGLGATVAHRAGEDQGQNVITQVTFAYGSGVAVTGADIAAVHRALVEWGVTTIVLPDQPELPAYDKVASVPLMASLMTAATGARPVHIADAWVWQAVNHDRPASFPSTARFSTCTSSVFGYSMAISTLAANCLLAGTSP
jgi:hypothetical protein